ncbi:RES domain-containing protein [Arthrobacter sp. I2-34]|uniref:RES domain-containing protein n=1 Tax=Arthrobacter hankyongi TaxID=2904801 RepID=A0ABS9L8T4_9MICC|nr:RES domain-containing protein [Arthrobacter hankyongi]MCG2623016.1 RES domain-containing protein [Arthrobacter hankyongi]
MRRTCTATGLALVDTRLEGYRIAKSSYGPVSPRPRPASPGADRSGWSRFDTPGSTIYLAGDRRTAYAETLSITRVGNRFRSAVSFAAAQFGIPEAEAQALVEEDWTRNGNMVPGWLPASWREGRLMYRLRMDGPASWVDLTAAESVAALNRHLGPAFDEELNIPQITLGALTGENREATTLIAQWIREQVLDDGSYAAGVRFHSKFGGGTCWAWWMRRTDDGLGPELVEIIAEDEIHPRDPDLDYVLKLYGASCR